MCVTHGRGRKNICPYICLLFVLSACHGAAPANPALVELAFSDGKPQWHCVNMPVLMQGVSRRNLKLTATARVEASVAWTCVVPVDWRYERFLLQSLECSTRSLDKPASVAMMLFVADGAIFQPKLELTRASPRSSLAFGAGLPLWSDVEMTAEGDAACRLAGLYVRETDPRRIWGPYQLGPRNGGTWTPNEDRR
jgi:hypothetical protein